MPRLISQENELDRIRFSSVLTETHTQAGNITEHPIEKREDVSDHRQKLPFRLSIEAVVTGNPMVSRIGGPIASVGGRSVEDEFGVYGDARLRLAVEFFDRNQDQTFEYLSARLGRIRDLMIESVEYTVDKEQRLVFNIELKQVSFGRSEIVDLPPLARRTQEPTIVQCPQPGEPLEPSGAGGGEEGEEGEVSIEVQSWLAGSSDLSSGFIERFY